MNWSIIHGQRTGVVPAETGGEKKWRRSRYDGLLSGQVVEQIKRTGCHEDFRTFFIRLTSPERSRVPRFKPRISLILAIPQRVSRIPSRNAKSPGFLDIKRRVKVSYQICFSFLSCHRTNLRERTVKKRRTTMISLYDFPSSIFRNEQYPLR